MRLQLSFQGKRNFWLWQEPNESLCVSVCLSIFLSGTSLSRALNLHLFASDSSWWHHDDLLTCNRDNMLDQREDHDIPETFPPVAPQNCLPRLAEAEVHYIFSFWHNHYFPGVFWGSEVGCMWRHIGKDTGLSPSPPLSFPLVLWHMTKFYYYSKSIIQERKI